MSNPREKKKSQDPTYQAPVQPDFKKPTVPDPARPGYAMFQATDNSGKQVTGYSTPDPDSGLIHISKSLSDPGVQQELIDKLTQFARQEETHLCLNRYKPEFRDIIKLIMEHDKKPSPNSPK